MISFKSFNLMLESFKDAKKNWLNAGQGWSPNAIDDYIKRFRSLNDRNRITDVSKRDIGFWMNKGFDKFISFVNEMEKVDEQKTNYRGMDGEIFKILDNEFCYVIVPRTFRASNKLGSSNWCIVYGNNYFDEYVGENGLTPYYIIFKETAKMIDWIYEFEGKEGDLTAIAVMVDESDDVHSIWDCQDNKIAESNVYEYIEGGGKPEDDDGDNVIAITLEEILESYGIKTYNFTSKVREIDPEPPVIQEHDVTNYFAEHDEGVIGSHEVFSQFGKQYHELEEYYKENGMTDRIVEYEYLEDYLMSCAVGQYVGSIKELDLDILQDHYQRTFDFPETEIIKTIYDDFDNFCSEIDSYYDEDIRWTLDY